MHSIAVASGKGGTGKTTVAVNLALALAKSGLKVQLLDCDVEEPNAHLFLKPEIISADEIGIPVPKVDPIRCNYCGYCAEICAFNALAAFVDQVMVFGELCHGCGSCAYLCPEKAISEAIRVIGVVETGFSGRLRFAQGRLNPGEAMAPPLIKAVRHKELSNGLTIIDAPPGTSCPVVTTVKDVDYCIMVTEPTPFGLNDLQLALGMVKKLSIPAGVVINRSDLGDDRVEKYCLEQSIPVLQKIPFNRELASLYARGIAVAEVSAA